MKMFVRRSAARSVPFLVVPLFLCHRSFGVVAGSSSLRSLRSSVDRHPLCGEERQLPCDRRPPHLVGLPDPTGWITVHGVEDTYFRRATAREREKNGWNEGSYLVSSPDVNAFAQGERASMVIPLDDSRWHKIDFVLDERIEGLQFVERVQLPKLDPNSRVSRVESKLRSPTLYEYFNDGFDAKNPGPIGGSWAKVISSNDGGLYAKGLAFDTEFEVDGPANNWVVDTDLPQDPVGFIHTFDPSNIVKVQLLDLGTYGRSVYNDQCVGAGVCEWFCAEMVGVPCDNNPHIGPSASHHCADDVDNDLDGTTDTADADCVAHSTDDYDWGDSIHPGFPKRHWESGNSFALFGEGTFCTKYATAEYSAAGVKTSGNWINRLTEQGWDAEYLLNQAVGFTGLSAGEKQFRYLAGGCWIFESFENAQNCMLDGDGCPESYPYSNAGVVASNYYSNVWDDVHHGTYVGLDVALHLAQVIYLGGFQDGVNSQIFCEDEDSCCGAAPMGSSDPSLWGSSVAQYEGCGVQTSSHEMGHACGLDHVGITSFMKSPSVYDPALPLFEKDQLLSCVASAGLPRHSGFRLNVF